MLNWAIRKHFYACYAALEHKVLYYKMYCVIICGPEIVSYIVS